MTKSGPRGTDDPDQVARLIGLAGARSTPSASVQHSVQAALEHEWRGTVSRRRTARALRRWFMACAGVLAIAAGWVAVRHELESPPLSVGTIVGTRGPARVISAIGRGLVVAGDVLPAGSRIETGPTGAALLSVGSVGVRVGPATVLAFERPGHIRVVRGQVYVDSGRTPGSSRLVVSTEFGNLSHFGTQYQVEVQPGRYLFTSVREGRILLTDYGRSQSVGRGEGLRVVGIDAVTRVVVPTYDARWQWASDFVPEFFIEGQTLSVFLDWIARETGRTLVFVGPTSRVDTDRTTLNGNISGLTPVQALNAVLASTRFQCDLSVPGDIRVSTRANGTVSMNRNAALL